MATKPLRSIQFPGLTDTYTIAATDTTLAFAGEPADAKATGDAIAEVDALATAADGKATVAEALAETGLVPYDNATDWSGNTSTNMTLTRKGWTVTLDGTLPKGSSSNISFHKVNGTPAWAGTTSAAQSFADPLTSLIVGHTYRWTVRRLSGTITTQTGGFGAGVIQAGSASTSDIGTETNSGDVYSRTFVAPSAGVYVGIRCKRTESVVTMDEVVLLCTLVDMDADTVPVSGTTPTITAETGKRYLCGEVSEISFTPCASGLCEVRFTSGTTAALLIVPGTVLWPSWFDPAHLRTSTTYVLNIADGKLGVVGVWS